MLGAMLVVGLLGALVLSGLSSGSETGVYCLNRVRLRVAVEEGQPAAVRLERLMRRPADLVITTLLGTNVADYLATACTTALLLYVAAVGQLAEVYATLIVTPLILVFGGIVPKDWFRRESNRLMLRLSWPLLVARQAARVTGLVSVLRWMTHALVRWFDPRRAVSAMDAELLPRARTLGLLREGAARGGLTLLQRDLIERVLNLSAVRAADVMIPRDRVAMVPLEIGRDDFLRVARMAHFSRLPVYRGDSRQVVGIVNVYDVLTDREDRPVAAHVRVPVTFVEGTSVAAALLELQGSRETMAMVEDGEGRCVGLLTLKDLVEEIVGDLEAW